MVSKTKAIYARRTVLSSIMPCPDSFGVRFSQNFRRNEMLFVRRAIFVSSLTVKIERRSNWLISVVQRDAR